MAADSLSLQDVINADWAESVARRRDDTQLAVARQRDGAGQDMRVIGGFLAAQLFASDDPERFAGLNAGVQVPTTLAKKE